MLGLEIGAWPPLRLALRRKASTAMLCVAAVALACGCSQFGGGRAAPVGAWPSLYYRGRLEQTLQSGLAEVHQASLSALKEMALPVLEDRADRLSAHLGSALSDGEPLAIDLEALGEMHTRVTIRAGLAGDRDRAARVLSAIRRHLQ